MTLQKGEKAGTEVIPTALYYTFSIKNAGNKKVGNEVEPLTFKIEPNEKLATVSQEVMGFNIFNPDGYNETCLGHGYTFDSILEPNVAGELALHDDLGINVETNEALFVLSKNQLKKLEDIKCKSIG